MSADNLIAFLRTVAARADILDGLVTRSKDEVIATAADFGLPFSEAEFDSVIWDLEVQLAAKRGEPFDAQFGLWQTMWGQYYLEYIVTDLLPRLEEAGRSRGGTNREQLRLRHRRLRARRLRARVPPGRGPQREGPGPGGGRRRRGRRRRHGGAVESTSRWNELLLTSIDWAYNSVPQPGLADHQVYSASGKGLGGTSNLFHMMHVRARREDLDDWAYNGAPGWSFDECLPYYQRSEHQVDGTNPTAGTRGPLNIVSASVTGNPISQALARRLRGARAIPSSTTSTRPTSGPAGIT